MKISLHWTLLDETMLLFSRTIESEFRRTHDTLFAAAFLDEFENAMTNVAMRSLLSQLQDIGPHT
jgi:hypothetical protein